jgi:hypothetical protein
MKQIGSPASQSRKEEEKKTVMHGVKPQDAGSIKRSFAKLVSEGSKGTLSYENKILLQQQDQLLKSLSRILTEMEECDIVKGSERTSNTQLGSIPKVCKVTSTARGMDPLLTSLHSDVSSITTCSCSIRAGKEKTKKLASESLAASTAARTSQGKAPTKKKKPRTQLECDLDSALQDRLRSLAALRAEDRTPTRPQRAPSHRRLLGPSPELDGGESSDDDLL